MSGRPEEGGRDLVGSAPELGSDDAIDLFASADTGQVWGPERFDRRNWQSGFGGGVQYRHSRTIAARVESGRSRERVALYASVSRGF